MKVPTETIYKVFFEGLEMEFKSLNEARVWMDFIKSVPIDDGPANVKIVEYVATRKADND